MNLRTNKVIFGTACDADPTQSASQHGHAMDTLRRCGIPFAEVRINQRDGVIDALLLESDSAEGHARNFGIGLEFARMFKREYLTEVHNDDACVIYDLRQGINPCERGTLREVSRSEATQSRRLTICEPFTGRYFGIDWAK